MRVLWYRDCRAINKMQFAVITADGDITAADKAIVLPCEWGRRRWSTQVATTEDDACP